MSIRPGCKPVLLLALIAPGASSAEPVPPIREVPATRLERVPLDAAPSLVANADGSVAAVMVSRVELGLFATSATTVLPDLEAWVVANAALLGLDPSVDGSPPMTLAPDEIVEAGAVTVHRFRQTVDGYDAFGPAETVSVVVVGGYARMVMGTLADERRTYAGERHHTNDRDALGHIGAAWLASGGTASFQVVGLELVAMPTWNSLAWVGQIQPFDGGPGALVLVDAVDGSHSWLDVARRYDLTDHEPVHVTAHEMTDDPTTDHLDRFEDLSGSVYGGCWEMLEGVEQCHLRMGDERMAVYDAQLDNAQAFTVWNRPKVGLFDFEPFAEFDADWVDGAEFQTQDIFHKVHAGLEVIDGHMAGLSWDHHPSSSLGGATPPPISLVTNLDSSPEVGEPGACSGALGWYDVIELQGVQWSDAESPYVGSPEQTTVIGICSMDESVALHELGHYLDGGALFGTLGHALGSDSCVVGTTDESVPAKETLADLVALALYRSLYPSLDYTMSGTDDPCTTGAAGVAYTTIHDESCGLPPGQFTEDWVDEPRAVDEPCSDELGYDQYALIQATWEFLQGRECDAAAPYTCATTDADPEALLRSTAVLLTATNHLSYESMFKGIGMVLAYNEGFAEGQRWARILEHHGLDIE